MTIPEGRKARAKKAYICMEVDEWIGGVVFATDKRQATRIGAANFSNGEPEYLDVKRAKHLDRYADTGVPASVLVWDGWHFECFGCGMKIDEDGMRKARLPIDGIVGTECREIYCCHACRCQYLAKSAAKKAFGEAFCDMLRDIVRKKFPNINYNFENYPAHHYIPYGSNECVASAIVKFDFPGQKYGPASIEYRHIGRYGAEIIGPVRPEFFCCNGDKGAFEALTEASQ